MLHLALSLLLLSQAPAPAPVEEAPANPDYVTPSGLKVFDPGKFADGQEVETWVQATLSLMAPLEQIEFLVRLQDAVLIIFPDISLPGDATPCGAPPPGYTLFGCTAMQEQVMIIAARECGTGRASAAIFSHESCHLMGHGHDYERCYRDNRWATIVEHEVCGG
jgi:hypothetical protein